MPIALTANTATRATLSALLPAAIRVFLAVYWLRQYARCYAYWPNGQYGYAGYAYCPGGQYGYAGCAISLSLNTRNDALFRYRSIRA